MRGKEQSSEQKKVKGLLNPISLVFLIIQRKNSIKISTMKMRIIIPFAQFKNTSSSRTSLARLHKK